MNGSGNYEQNCSYKTSLYAGTTRVCGRTRPDIPSDNLFCQMGCRDSDNRATGVNQQETRKMKDIEVLVVSHEAGITQGCKACRTVLRSGRYAIGLVIDGDKKFLLGEDPPVICCGGEKMIFLCYKTEREAESVKQELLSDLERIGSTVGLRLISWTYPDLN